jgi:hypothetical protein
MMLVCQSCARDLGAGDVAPICRGACETCGGGLGVSGWPLIELPRAVEEGYHQARRDALRRWKRGERRCHQANLQNTEPP